MKGRVFLEDAASPESVSVSFLFNGYTDKVGKPGADGTYSVLLKEGVYRVEITAPGYDSSVQKNLNATAGTTELDDVTLSVSHSPVSVKVTDKAGNPRTALRLVLRRRPYASGTQYVTDSNGYISENLGFGEHEVLKVDNTPASAAYLWTIAGATIGRFQRLANQSTYSVVLPSVLQAEISGSGAAFSIVPTSERFYAQSFTLAATTSFCGIGFGLGGYANSRRADHFQIRADSMGEPAGTVLMDSVPFQSTSALSTGGEVSYASFCDSSASSRSLSVGTYWLVASFDSVPSQLQSLGGTSLPANGMEVKSSSDGTSWGTATLTNSWRMLDFVIVE